MALQTTEFTGLDLDLSVDGSAIGGKDDATLTLSRDSSELPPNSSTGSQFGRSLVGLRDATIDFNALWIASSSALNGFSPTIDVGGGTSPDTLGGVTEVTINLQRDNVEFANDQHSGWRARRPSVLRATLNISLDYFDPESTTGAAYKALQTAFETTAGTETVDVALPGGNTSFSSSWVIEEIPIGGGNSDPVNNTLTLQSTGTITETINANLGSGLDTLITNLFTAPDSATAITALLANSAGNTEYTGDFWPENLEITIPVADSENGVTVSGTLAAADSLTIQVTS